MATSPPSKRMKLDFLLNHESSRSDTTLARDRLSHLQPLSYVPHAKTTLSPRVTVQSKAAKDGANFAVRSGPKGDVNFPPFQDFDDATLAQVRKFSVYPLGDIQNFCRHIPYNSGKKDFQAKTGREGFAVFQYTFTFPPGQDTYTVMWDYNIGLVRITPFFRCCKYPKTTPGKMLCLNPGLKELSHSITGGAIVAQGYWLPYNSARAVCATFCYYISAAMVPIFGPDFPSTCTPPGSEGYGYMKIDPQIVRAAAREAEIFRLRYGTAQTIGASKSTVISSSSTATVLSPTPRCDLPTRRFTPWNAQPRPSIESQAMDTPATTPARTPLPRHPISATHFPSPETPTIRSPETFSYRPPSYDQSHEWSCNTGSRSGPISSSARQGDEKWSALRRQLNQGSSHLSWSPTSPHISSRKRGSSELYNSDEDNVPIREHVGFVRPSNIRPLSRRPLICLSPPNSSYPSSICSEAGQPHSPDVSRRNSPTIESASISKLSRLDTPLPTRAPTPEQPNVDAQTASQVAALVLLEMSSSTLNSVQPSPEKSYVKKLRANSF